MKTSDNSKNSIPVMIAVLPLLAMLAAILPSVVMNNVNLDTVKISVILLLLSLIVVFYIRVNADTILNKKLAKTIIILGYLCSISLLLFIPYPETFSFWMLGGLLVAMLVDSKLGLILHFNLSFLMGLMITQKPEDVIQVLIIGMLMSMLSGALLKPATVIYAAIIILSSNITIAFAIHNFSFSETLNYNYLKSLFSVSAVLLVAFLLGFLYQVLLKSASSKDSVAVEKLLAAYSQDLTTVQESGNRDNVHQPVSGDEAVVIAEAKDGTKKEAFYAAKNEIHKDTDVLMPQTTPGARTSYDVLCDSGNDLINKIKQHSEALYQHSLYIGDLSHRAAAEVGANEKLAFAGGLYHEVGKIRGKNYIEEGLIIAEDYSFPNELKTILKEHNIKYEKPSTVEAAIVMLSDSVVSTLDYIEKNDEHKFSTKKVIENIFQLRMDKGTFDSTNLSLKDYKKLKDFYQREFNKG